MFILQFVFVKPMMAAVALLLDAADLYNEGTFAFSSGYLYVTVVNNISVTLSLYYLIMFYFSTREQLIALNPVGKFLSVKAVLFFSFWYASSTALAHTLTAYVESA